MNVFSHVFQYSQFVSACVHAYIYAWVALTLIIHVLFIYEGCLFNIEEDPTEHNDLMKTKSNDTSIQELFAKLTVSVMVVMVYGVWYMVYDV